MELKREIRGRDETVQCKEKEITELKKDLRTTEKHSFVLNHKIKLLEDEILPKENKISEMKSQILAMEEELTNVVRDQAEFNVLTKDMKPAPVAHEKAQVLTNPPKEGHHLTPGITFGAPGGHKKGSEFEHLADPISAQREAETAERKHHEKMRGGRAPFRSMSRSVDFFDAQVAEPPARARLPRTPPCHCRALAMPI